MKIIHAGDISTILATGVLDLVVVTTWRSLREKNLMKFTNMENQFLSISWCHDSAYPLLMSCFECLLLHKTAKWARWGCEKWSNQLIKIIFLQKMQKRFFRSHDDTFHPKSEFHLSKFRLISDVSQYLSCLIFHSNFDFWNAWWQFLIFDF